MSTATLRKQLMQMPQLAVFWQEINLELQNEQTKRAEFRTWLTEQFKAEFINGDIVMHSPASCGHNDAVINIGTFVNIHSTFKASGKVQVEKALVGLTRNDYEPDVAFWRKDIADGFTADMNVYPAPNFIVEVLSKSTAKTDRETKFDDYAAHGIEEYWIVDPKKQTVEQYILPTEDSRRYALLKKLTIEDDIESYVLTGFKIPVRAIFDETEKLMVLENLMKN